MGEPKFEIEATPGTVMKFQKVSDVPTLSDAGKPKVNHSSGRCCNVKVSSTEGVKVHRMIVWDSAEKGIS
jgi:hypothetical protein